MPLSRRVLSRFTLPTTVCIDDAASTTTGVLPAIGSTAAVTSFGPATAADTTKVGVQTTNVFNIAFTTSTALLINSFIVFTLPAANFSNVGAATMTGQSTAASTCSLLSTTQLRCIFTAALPAGASTIALTGGAGGWVPGTTVNSTQFPTIPTFNKATYTISNLMSPPKYLAAATYSAAAANNYKASFGSNECSAALAFP